MKQPGVKTGGALVTGAGRRIGRAIALDLAAGGWRVAVHYNTSRVEAEQVVAEIRAAGGQAAAVGADLADEAATAGLVADAVSAVGPLTCLVNNASTFEYDDAATATRASWDLHMEVNLRAPFVLAQAFAAAKPPGVPGAIINLIDQRVWRPTPKFMTYTVSKAGLWTLTRTLAQALAPEIRVNAIGPGPALPSPRQTADHFSRQCANVLLQRGTTPAEICAALRFLLSAPAVTGQMIALDGGQHLAWQTPDVLGGTE